ncbi:hypothetical protein [Actinomadura opuntiae]|uniref:hypothetical protein n=1 Tax=Actinomadura sp. OS1-43 TaxID=604315 RepID=UPI00255AD6CC|nr:hypothetical protein [Actinomadura sp. OS1-43]MDL4814974.1 hypothetical protein [Actinomadura sp. OS1-43]
MSNVIPLRWPDGPDDDPVREGELFGRQLTAEHAIAHAQTGICFGCWFNGLPECGIDPLCETFRDEDTPGSVCAGRRE